MTRKSAVAEPIEGEVIEQEQEESTMVPAVTASPGSAAGTAALAALSEADFDKRLAALRSGRERVARIQRDLMVESVDYGLIPGTPKPTLLKPGAEKLCDFYQLAARIEVEFVAGDGVTTPPLTYNAACFLHLGSTDGPIVATGHGTANSWERRYRYRRAERTCPACGKAGALNKSKRDPEFYCWAKKGGCGATFPLTDERITGQELGDVENPDPWDLAVTLLKMAEKRAHVDATLRATATSGLFTQDVEDLPGGHDPNAEATGDEQPTEPRRTGSTAGLRQAASKPTNGTGPDWTAFWRAARPNGWKTGDQVLAKAQAIWPSLTSLGDLDEAQFRELLETVSTEKAA